MRATQQEINESERRMAKNTMVPPSSNKEQANLYSCQKMSRKILGQVADFLAKGGEIEYVPSVQDLSATTKMGYTMEVRI